MSKLNPDEKHGGYSGSKPKDEVIAPKSQGAGATITPTPVDTGSTETSASEKDAA